MKIITAYDWDMNNVALIPTVMLYRAHCDDPNCDTTHGISVHLLVFIFTFSIIFQFEE